MAQCQWWREPELTDVEEGTVWAGCAAARMWRSACHTLVAPYYERAWQRVCDKAPPDAVWHTLRNCTAYQAGVWANLLQKGAEDVTHPAGFKLAVVLRHTPTQLSVKLLADLLCTHPQSQDLIDYILALLTDDEPSWCGICGGGAPDNMLRDTDPMRPNHAPLRDLQLFGDCELAILAASREEYDAHAKLVRAEYAKLARENYLELRIKILNQLTSIPRIFHSPEFSAFESAARENIDREVNTIREHLLTHRRH